MITMTFRHRACDLRSLFVSRFVALFVFFLIGSASTAFAQSPTPIDSLVEAEQFAQAIPLLEKELARAPSDSAAVELRSTLMFCRFQEGDFTGARREQERVVELRAKIAGANDPQLADDLNDFAMICDKLDDDEAAANAWRRSIAILSAATPPDAARIVPRTSALAEAERRLGRIEESERLMREAIALSEKSLPRNHRHARLLNNLGALEWDQRRFDEASRDLREALAISEADTTATPLRIAVAYHNLANLKREQGDWEESERLHGQALSIARAKLPDDPQFPIFLKELAVLHAQQGRAKEAFALWDEALAALRKSPQTILESEILYERGRAFLERGEAADSSLRACLSIREAECSSNHPMIGQVLVAQGTLDMSRADRTGRRMTAAARRNFERAASILDASSIYPEERVEAHQGIAQLDWSDGRRTEAVERMSRSLDMVENIRMHRSASDVSRADWMRRTADPTYTMIGWLVDLGRIDEAIAVAERIRGRVLGDQLAAAHVDWRRGVPAEMRRTLTTKEQAAEARIRSLRRDLEAAFAAGEESKAPAIEKKLRAAVAEYRDVQEQMRVESPAWSKSMSAVPTARIVADVQKKLPAGELALSYAIGAQRSFAFVIPAKGPARAAELRVPAETAAAWSVSAGPLRDSTLEVIVKDGRGPAPRVIETKAVRGVGAARPASGKSTAPLSERQRDLARLAAILVPDAIRGDVRGATRVHLVPDGALHDVPFEALVLGDAEWLAVGPPLSYGHSLATFVGVASRKRSSPTDAVILTVSDPETGSRWAPLPGARRESDALAAAFAGDTIVRLVGADAREARVKKESPRARILHFGTHGFVERERNDLLAALVLAEEPKDAAEDGFLHLFEVYELDLSQRSRRALRLRDPARGTRPRRRSVRALAWILRGGCATSRGEPLARRRRRHLRAHERVLRRAGEVRRRDPGAPVRQAIDPRSAQVGRPLLLGGLRLQRNVLKGDRPRISVRFPSRRSFYRVSDPEVRGPGQCRPGTATSDFGRGARSGRSDSAAPGCNGHE